MKSPQTRDADLTAGMRATWAGMAVNILLVFIKCTVGYLARSQALVADGIHSLSDLISDIVVLLGLRWGRRRADEKHPYGHGRIETVAGLIMGLILVAAAIAIAVRAVLTLYQTEPMVPGAAAIAAAVASIVFKEALYWYTLRVGRRIKSLVVIGNAWHHRTDAFSSVAVLAGIIASRIHPDWHAADVLAALAVTYFILKVGSNMIWTALREVIDTAPDSEVLRQLEVEARAVEGVRQVHDIKARYSANRIMVEIHIVVDPDLTVRQGHDIADEVRQRLVSEVGDVVHVVVHVDPEPDDDNPQL
ncbi:MAG: cation diffusion facilitator family transporter [bacterium]